MDLYEAQLKLLEAQRLDLNPINSITYPLLGSVITKQTVIWDQYGPVLVLDKNLAHCYSSSRVTNIIIATNITFVTNITIITIITLFSIITCVNPFDFLHQAQIGFLRQSSQSSMTWQLCRSVDELKVLRDASLNDVKTTTMTTTATFLTFIVCLEIIFFLHY